MSNPSTYAVRSPPSLSTAFSVYLKTLVRIGVLQEVKIGWERLFTNLALLGLLTGDPEG